MLDFNLLPIQPRNLIAGAELVIRAHRLQLDDPPEPAPSVQGNIPHYARFMWVPRENPSMIVWKGGGKMVIAISGLNFQTDFWFFITGASTPIKYSTLPGKVNSMAANWAGRVRTSLLSGLTADVTDLWIYGHSMGSTVAHLTGWYAKQQRPDLNVGVVTYASPKWCDFRAAQELSQCMTVRVMANGDPMTYVMPSVSQAPVFCGFFDPISVWRWTTAYHIPTGVAIDRNGNWENREDPIGMPTPIDWNIDTFIRENVKPDSAHNMEEILRRMRMAWDPQLHGADTVAPIVPRLPDSQRPPPIPPAQVETQVRAARSVMENRFALPMWVKQQTSRVQVRKVGLDWIVTLDGKTKYFGTSKSDARGMAKALRNMLHQYTQHPGRFNDSDDLLASFRGEVPAPLNPDIQLDD